MAQKKNRRTLRIMGPKESIKDLGARFKRLKKGPIGKSVSSAGEGIKKAGKWAKTRTFTGETSLFSRKQFSGGKKKTKRVTTRSKMEAANKAIMGEGMVESIKKRAKSSKDDKARMQRLKKNNPAKYKQEKKKRRAAAMIAERNKKSWERD